MTGVEVMVIVDTSRQRTVWGSEKLLRDFNNGGIGSQANQKIIEQVAGEIEALENTPDKVQELIPSPLARLYGHSSSSQGPEAQPLPQSKASGLQPRCLLPVMNAPEPVKNLLLAKPVPKVTSLEKPAEVIHCKVVTFISDGSVFTIDTKF